MIMKYLLLSIYCITLSTFLIQAKDSPIITGNIHGFGNDTVVAFCVSVSNGSIKALDTIIAKNGCFELDIDVPEALECALYSNKSYVVRANGKRYLPETSIIKVLLFPDSKVTLKGTARPFIVDYQANGDIFNEEMSKRRSSMILLKSSFVRKDLMLDSLAFYKTDRKVLDGMDSVLTRQKDSAIIPDIEYIKEYSNRDLAAYYLCNMPQDSFLKYLPFLKSNVRSGVFKQKLDLLENNYQSVHKIKEALKRVVIGAIAPDFKLQSLNNKTVQLSDYKGKYIALYFWGSSFQWCIQGMPTMRTYYEKYKNKVEFIGIDVRDSEDVWRKTVRTLEMNWVQLRNLTTTDIPELYGISAYPTKIILDPDLKIVARIVGEDPAFYKALDDLFSVR